MLQWNFGQGSLQPLLREMAEQHPDVAQVIFGSYFGPLQEALAAPQEELMSFARSEAQFGIRLERPGAQ